MTFAEYTKFVNEYDFSNGTTWYHGLGLAGETGEVIELIKKSHRTGKRYQPINPEQLALELGDVLWYLTRLAHMHGYNLEQIALMNQMKLAQRKAKETNGTNSSGSVSINQSS